MDVVRQNEEECDEFGRRISDYVFGIQCSNLSGFYNYRKDEGRIQTDAPVNFSINNYVAEFVLPGFGEVQVQKR